MRHDPSDVRSFDPRPDDPKGMHRKPVIGTIFIVIAMTIMLVVVMTVMVVVVIIMVVVMVVTIIMVVVVVTIILMLMVTIIMVCGGGYNNHDSGDVFPNKKFLTKTGLFLASNGSFYN